ncbi:hypothetical protein [Methylophaga sp. OBS4]|uniref:hypothetical protein n=1 Tax=Methylophaga sp. OBS4 TaxID=2991935 RepID=UPI0022512A7E|nr:hypothetical protein [Methylophaga sp. OBS4]MCX4188241.1 hypothetical protein [Methylophaga sp. OBS4]
MKRLVNLIQLAIVVAILYPLFYVWDTDRVDNFCKLVKPGMSQDELVALADDNGMNLIGPNPINLSGGRWIASVPSRASFAGYACVIKGAADTVATAKIIRGE